MGYRYLLTASGGYFHLNPHAKVKPAVRIHDVAAHLAKLCRFAGATTSFYSIAQHAVLVSDIVASSKRPENTPETRLYALLDSAHKAYIGEMTPLGRQAMVDYLADYWAPARVADDGRELPNPYDAVAEPVRMRIMAALGFKWPPSAEQAAMIKAASRIALATEVRDLMPDDPDLESWRLPPAHNRPIGKALPWDKAEDLFLRRWSELCALANHEVPHVATGKAAR